MFVYCREKLENEQDANGKLRKERDGLLKKSNELESEVEELKNYNDQLGIKHQKAISEHAETVRNLKVGLETSAILKLALIGVVYFFLGPCGNFITVLSSTAIRTGSSSQ